MLCMLKHTLFSCVYAKGVFSIHKITTASNCKKNTWVALFYFLVSVTQNQGMYKEQSNKSVAHPAIMGDGRGY